VSDPDWEAETTERPSLEWWICTDFLRLGGEKVMGPFCSEGLALTVRYYVERCTVPTTYAVDSAGRGGR
jgi:hypothetical protein